MSTNNFFRTFNSITPYPPGDAVNRFSYLTKNSYRGCGTGGGQYTGKFTSAETACASSNNNSCSTEFYISFPSGSLQSGSSKVYSDAEGTTLAYPNGGDGYFHISASYDNGFIDGKSPIGVYGGFSCKIETGSIITELVSCDLYQYNTASLSKRVASSALACAETVTSHSVFYSGALTASTSNILVASFLYTKSADTLVRFDNALTGIGSTAGFMKVFSTSETPENQYGGNNHALYWNLVGGTASTYSFVACGNGATKIKISANSNFLGVCSQSMPNIAFSSTGLYPSIGTIMYSSSLSSGAYLNAGYYKVSGSALNLYYIQVGSGGEVSSTGTCGTPP